MYNLTVDEAHTFFVGEGQWLVHNACNPRFQTGGGNQGNDVLTKGFHIDSDLGELSLRPEMGRVSGRDTVLINIEPAAGNNAITQANISRADRTAIYGFLDSNQQQALDQAAGIISNWADNPLYAGRVQEAYMLIQGWSGLDPWGVLASPRP